jgi:acetolactate synthase-1/2/3 large subunit
MLSISEYVAGFVPIGHYIATQRIAACITTTGAATKLASSGITDAKMHNIPAVYVVGLNASHERGCSPLQDVGEDGMNIVAQLRAEVGDACLVVDDLRQLPEHARTARRLLAEHRPVVFAVHPDSLMEPVTEKVSSAAGSVIDGAYQASHEATRAADELRRAVAGRRVVLFVGEESADCTDIRKLTTELAELLGAATVWSTNGAWAVSPDNRFGYGYVSFGGNDHAMRLWHGLNEDDVLLMLGVDPGEYVMELAPIAAGAVFHLTDLPAAYGSRDGDFGHRCTGRYHRVSGDIGETLRVWLAELSAEQVTSLRWPPAPSDLNDPMSTPPLHAGCVDFEQFLTRLHQKWRPGTLVFDDVCLAYKDRQFVTQRPSATARVFSAHQSSAMGSAFGHAIGARLALPETPVFCFSGDGCYRLYGGALADVAQLGLRLFIIDNNSYGIIQQGYSRILPDTEASRYHSALPQIDFVSAARAHGWDGVEIADDLSNLDDILDACYSPNPRSLLVNVPVDAAQVLGRNPRINSLALTDSQGA